MVKRAAGLGTVTTTKGGRFWARAPRLPDGTRPSLGIYDTWDEADEVRAAAVNKLADADLTHVAGVTLRAFGVRRLEELALEDEVCAPHRASRWKHILGADFIDDPIDSISRPAVVAFIKKLKTKKVKRGRGPGAKLRTIARGTVRVTIGLLSSLFVAASEEGLCSTNPAAGHRIKSSKKKSGGAARDPDEAAVWTYLPPEEQASVLTCETTPEADRLIIGCAIGACLRLGEQMNLHLPDVHAFGPDPHVMVRWGSKGRLPKNGKVRKVPLFGLGLACFRRWLEVLPTYAPKNPEQLVFPYPSGRRRGPSKHLHRGSGHKVNGFHQALEHAGITRRVRWHDLRHTGASSLVAGWWGPAWRLEEVKEVLGHSTIRITERYAHLAPAVVADLAARTRGLPVGYDLDATPGALPVISRAVRTVEAAPGSGSC